MRKKTHIYSIFGQIDAVVANAMIAEGKCNKIERVHIPASARFSDSGEEAQFAVVVPGEYKGEFERRCAELRA